MATELWGNANNRSTVLTTQLNSLASGAYSAVGTEIDNSVNLDIWAVAQIVVTFGSAPTVNEVISLFGVCAPDGTNYQDGAAALRYPQDTFCGVFQVYNNTSAQRLLTKPFLLRPYKTKFALANNTSQNFPASGTVVTLFTYDRTIG